MEFFENDLTPEVAEDHIERIVSLEQSEAERVLKLYKRVRQELRDRLDLLPRDKFTAQQMRGTLLQIELAIIEMNRILSEEVSSSAQLAAETGVDHLIKELTKFEKHFRGAVVPINLDAILVATETKNFLFNKYDASLKAYGEGLRSHFASTLTEAAAQQKSSGEVVSDISKVFLGEEWRLHRLVRTELHSVYNTGKIRGMTDLRENEMPDLMKTLFHPMDSRTGADSKRLNRNNPIVPVDEPFVESSTGRKLTYMAPPNRPNDRAILIPYREGWGGQ